MFSSETEVDWLIRVLKREMEVDEDEDDILHKYDFMGIVAFNLDFF